MKVENELVFDQMFASVNFGIHFGMAIAPQKIVPQENAPREIAPWEIAP